MGIEIYVFASSYTFQKILEITNLMVKIKTLSITTGNR